MRPSVCVILGLVGRHLRRTRTKRRRMIMTRMRTRNRIMITAAIGAHGRIAAILRNTETMMRMNRTSWIIEVVSDPTNRLIVMMIGTTLEATRIREADVAGMSMMVKKMRTTMEVVEGANIPAKPVALLNLPPTHLMRCPSHRKTVSVWYSLCLSSFQSATTTLQTHETKQPHTCRTNYANACRQRYPKSTKFWFFFFSARKSQSPLSNKKEET
mmetsp:Transcript_1840/g.4003  ORF Transcript_1840/g.4003 Transcript_1840/m.4003 type:complete len:214 (+) Transcript_1840:2605-3246(+)